MEIDVASVGTADQSPATPSTSAFSKQKGSLSPKPTRNLPQQQQVQQDQPSTSGQLQQLSDSDRRREASYDKRGNPSGQYHAPTHTLKSILRQRSDVAPRYPKYRRRRVVHFNIEEKPEERHVWSGSRLRHLALDLDRWDNVPALRSINKQKTRHTKCLKCRDTCHDMGSSCKAAKPKMDNETSLGPTDQLWTASSDKKNVSFARRPDTPETVPGIESMERSLFVDRWLQQNSFLNQQQQEQQHLLESEEQQGASSPTPFCSSNSFTMSSQSDRAQQVSPIPTPAPVPAVPSFSFTPISSNHHQPYHGQHPYGHHLYNHTYLTPPCPNNYHNPDHYHHPLHRYHHSATPNVSPDPCCSYSGGVGVGGGVGGGGGGGGTVTVENVFRPVFSIPLRPPSSSASDVPRADAAVASPAPGPNPVPAPARDSGATISLQRLTMDFNQALSFASRSQRHE